jgi:hypothetical protein
MEEPIICTTEKGENEPQLDENHAHRVFRRPRHCSSRIRPPGPDRQHKVLLRSSAAFEGEHSAKATGSVAREEMDSPRRQCTRHRALLIRESLANRNMFSLPHPPYSPDLAPADFFLFPKMKLQLKGRRFHTVAEIQRESQTTTHVFTETPNVSIRLAHCLIKIEGHYSCERNPVLPSAGALQS